MFVILMSWLILEGEQWTTSDRTVATIRMFS